MFLIVLTPLAACSRDALPSTAAPVTDAPTSMPEEEYQNEPLEQGLPTVDISVDGSTVVIRGDMDIDFYERFLDAVRGKEDTIRTVHIDSGGGVTTEGIKLGEWMFERKVDVVVENLCFSSCANYVFTAGKNKTIKSDSIVGWHGSEQQDEYIARSMGLSVEEYAAQVCDEEFTEPGETPSDSERKACVDELVTQQPMMIKKEQAFLSKIGVNADALLYGLLPGQIEEYGKSSVQGWTFSIEDMAKFGIDNIVYEGAGEYPNEQALQKYEVIVFQTP